MLSVVLLGFAFTLFCYKIFKTYNFWKQREVIYIKPWPIFGNFGPFTLTFRSFAQVVKDLYDYYPDKRCVGVYQFLTPLLMIREPDIIKQITIKEFDSFSEHRTFVSEDVDPAWGKNLFQMSTNRWRDMRPVLSPVFTSGKMKSMFVLMIECAEEFVNHFAQQNEDVITVEIEDVVSRFANDAIVRTAYGVNCNSLSDRENDFYKNGQGLLNFGGFAGLKFFASSFSPALVKFFKIRLIDESVRKFFANVIIETMQIRRDKKIVRPDFIHLLMEAQKGRLKYEERNPEIPEAGFATVEESALGKDGKKVYQITDEDVTAQALVFYLGSFQAVSETMSFLAYELLVNPDIQRKLIKEVDETYKNCNGKITYEMLLNMKYLDMVVSETLRKWPPPLMIDRKCTKEYVIQPVKPKEKPIQVDVGTICMIPIYGLHHDPLYYPNPEKFDPERFNDTNRKNINPFTYMPFGLGPRNCIGSRYALLEIKLLFFYLLANFEIVPVNETKVPLVLSTTEMNLMIKGGLWVGFKNRNKLKH